MANSQVGKANNYYISNASILFIFGRLLNGEQSQFYAPRFIYIKFQIMIHPLLGPSTSAA